MRNLFIGLSIVISGSAYANCSNQVIADCGDFKVTSSSCQNASMTAVFHDESFPFYRANEDGEGVKIYRAHLSSADELYVDIASVQGADGRLHPTYKTYDQDVDSLSDAKNCIAVSSEASVTPPSAPTAAY